MASPISCNRSSRGYDSKELCTVLDKLPIKFPEPFYYWIGEGKSIADAAEQAERM
jgi:hypothetical protein